MVVLIPIVPRADSGWYLVVPLLLSGIGLGLLVSQLNNYTLSPMSEEQVSEAAGVNSAAGSFGLSFGLAFAGAIMLATISILATALAQDSTSVGGRPAAGRHRGRAGRPGDERHPAERDPGRGTAGGPGGGVRINAEARDRALQVALLVPLLAGLVGLLSSLRMRRLPDPDPSSSVEGMALG